MDVDTPNLLKRCSSAPLINEAVSTTATSPTTNTIPRTTAFFGMFSNNNLQRTRRFSTSSSYGAVAGAPSVIASPWAPRLTPRVNQLRAEECADVTNTRELAHERETHCAMQMGQSCEDLTLLATGLANSPTRVTRFSPVVSPSPTRKYTTRRSLSPIALRASSFSPVSHRPNLLLCKRRGDEADSPLPKRMCTSDRLTPSTPGTPGTPGTPDSDSLECTFRPVSPRAQPMNDSPDSNHKTTNPS